jgi:serine/threonine protein kinase
MHTGELLHRDIKPSNLLLNSDCMVKLADFGLARSVSQLNTHDGHNPILTDYVATRWYRAPEILLGSTKYTYGVDMWSCGECACAWLHGCLPVLPGCLPACLPVCRCVRMPGGRAVPEVLLGSIKYTYGLDMWSCGGSVSACLSVPPFCLSDCVGASVCRAVRLCRRSCWGALK